MGHVQTNVVVQHKPRLKRVYGSHDCDAYRSLFVDPIRARYVITKSAGGFEA
jgi:hypothetical protein